MKNFPNIIFYFVADKKQMACMNTVSNKSKPTSPPNPPHHKRKSESEEMTPKKAKVTYASGKNPVQLLHEKFSPIEYKFTQEGKVVFIYVLNYFQLQ